MPWDPRAASPVHASGNRQTRPLVPVADPTVAHDPAPAPVGCGPGDPRKHWLKQSPTDKKASVGVKVSSGEVLAQQWSNKRKKKGVWTHWKLFLHHPSPKAA